MNAKADQKQDDSEISDASLRSLESLRKKLLDLSARNRLINYRFTKRSCLRVIDELPNQLIEVLVGQEAEMSFAAVEEPTESELLAAGYLSKDVDTGDVSRVKKDPSAAEWAKHKGFHTSYEMPELGQEGVSGEDKHADTAIQTLLYAHEMDNTLKNIYQLANSAIEETGTNILYLALGNLEWFDSGKDQPRLAPLFLVPVRLKRSKLDNVSKRYGYRLVYSGEDLIPNLSLREKLREDFALALPELDDNTEPEAYFADLQAVIEREQPNWSIRRYVTLGLLDFSKLLMYLDLDPERWPKDANIANHAIVGKFLGNRELDADDGGGYNFASEIDIDHVQNVHDLYPLVAEADSSQHSALIDAIDGKSLVIEGPPGTGKSQTITNLIAAALAQGRSVLFVAEKLAALEVVKRRLDRLDLGDFCLELHSHKTQKKKVLEDIDRRLKKRGSYLPPHALETNVSRLEENREKLRAHADLVNSEFNRSGKTIQQILAGASRYRMELPISPENLALHNFDPASFNAGTQSDLVDQVDMLCTTLMAVRARFGQEYAVEEMPWFGVCNASLQMFDTDAVVQQLSAWRGTLTDLLLECSSAVATLSLVGVAGELTEKTFLKLCEELELPSAAGEDVFYSAIPHLAGETLTQSERYLKLGMSITGAFEKLSTVIDERYLTDFDRVPSLLEAAGYVKRYVGHDQKVDEVITRVKGASTLRAGVEDLLPALEATQDALGSQAAEVFNLTESGLEELAILASLAAKLPPELYARRSDRFDNDALDSLLRKLGDRQAMLLEQQAEVGRYFDLKRLPQAQELQATLVQVENGGVLRWLKPSWWKARGILMSFRAEPDLKLSDLMTNAREAIEFRETFEAFEADSEFSSLLGDEFKGLESATSSLNLLRTWYAAVRKEYGIGFGKRVSIGSGLLGLDSQILRALASIGGERGSGGTQSLPQLLAEVKALKSIYRDGEKVKRRNQNLDPEDSTLFSRSIDLVEKLDACTDAHPDINISVSTLSERLEKLEKLSRALTAWKKVNLNQAYFNGDLSIDLSLHADNRVVFRKLQRTLNLAVKISEVQTAGLREYLYNNATQQAYANLQPLLNGLKQAHDKYDSARSAFAERVSLNLVQWHGGSSPCFADVEARIDGALEYPADLSNWLDYLRVRNRVIERGLTAIVEKLESAELLIEQAKPAVLSAMYDALSRHLLELHPALTQFSGTSQEAIQAKYKEYDEGIAKLQRAQVAWKVDQRNVPEGKRSAKVAELTELALLSKECSKKTRHIPIRRLVDRAPKALLGLKPCFMMGPMSVAQFLTPGCFEFDLVIMDEASQIKPEDALGAIGRAGQLVVVGDPKQMPPSNYFNRVIDGQDDDQDEEVGLQSSESILDAALPMFNARRLRWHYRSQHESLIAFSNYAFYDGDLVVFPSPNRDSADHGVSYHRIGKGAFINQRNTEEARCIAAALKKHFSEHPDDTVGVVAMSISQKNQIEAEVESLAKEDPQFAEKLEASSASLEPWFIKNLENVQGDERDVIIISMTYGPAAPGGKVAQRFGPINSAVGGRRLNVLFTRARKRMQVFASMGKDDIVIGSSASAGVRALRDFLAYCENGTLSSIDIDPESEPDSDFEVAVIRQLQDAGYTCVPQVGVAGYRIDIGVLDPGNSGRYLMGIECDGATYHSAKSTRDRDRLRQEILENLGWEIRRIWSTDWFKNPRAELKPILAELDAMKTEPVAIEEVHYDPDLSLVVNNDEKIMEPGREFIDSASKDLPEGGGLAGALERFDAAVIRPSFPDTPIAKRLLRPALLEAFVEYEPVNQSEFLELIPGYLRSATDISEGKKYLNDVLAIINQHIDDDSQAQLL